MIIENVPWCCTAAILASFGEHGEPSEVTLEEIRRLTGQKRKEVYEEIHGHRILIDGAKRIVIAFSVDPANIKMLEEAGFKVVDKYKGIQGTVHLLTLHLKD